MSTDKIQVGPRGEIWTQMYPEEIGYLLNAAVSGKVADLTGNEIALACEARTNILETIHDVLLVNHCAKETFREANGFSEVTTVLKNMVPECAGPAMVSMHEETLDHKMHLLETMLSMLKEAVRGHHKNRTAFLLATGWGVIKRPLQKSGLICAAYESRIIDAFMNLAVEGDGILIMPNHPESSEAGDYHSRKMMSADNCITTQAGNVCTTSISPQSGECKAGNPSITSQKGCREIYNGGAIQILLDCMLDFTEESQLKILIELDELASNRPRNHEVLTSVGCVGLLLDAIVSRMHGTSEPLLSHALGLVKKLGAYRLSPWELRAICKQIPAGQKDGHSSCAAATYALELLEEMSSWEDDQDYSKSSFLDFDMTRIGHGSARARLGPDCIWPPAAGYSFVCWMKFKGLRQQIPVVQAISVPDLRQSQLQIGEHALHTKIAEESSLDRNALPTCSLQTMSSMAEETQSSNPFMQKSPSSWLNSSLDSPGKGVGTLSTGTVASSGSDARGGEDLSPLSDQFWTPTAVGSDGTIVHGKGCNSFAQRYASSHRRSSSLGRFFGRYGTRKDVESRHSDQMVPNPVPMQRLQLFTIGPQDEKSVPHTEIWIDDMGMITINEGVNNRLTFPGVQLKEGLWHHIAVVYHRAKTLKGLFQSAHVSLYVNGGLKTAGQLQPSSPSLSKSVEVTLGTPSSSALVSDIRWQLGPCLLYEEVLPSPAIFYMYTLGRSYCGLFQDPELPKFLPYEAAGDGNLSIAEALGREGVASNAGELKDSGGITLDGSGVIWDSEAGPLRKLAMSQLAAKKLIFAFNGTHAEVCNTSSARSMVNLVDPVSSAASLTCAVAKMAWLHGDVQICLPFSTSDVFRKIGGMEIILAIMQNLKSGRDFSLALSLLAKALYKNPRNACAMKEVMGYHLLARILHEKMELVNVDNIQILFRIAACEGLPRKVISKVSTKRIPDPSPSMNPSTEQTPEEPQTLVFANPEMAQHVLLAWSVWIQATVGLQIMVLNFFQQLVGKNKFRRHNIAALRKIHFVSHVLLLLRHRDADMRVVNRGVQLLAAYLENGYNHNHSDLKLIADFLLLTFKPKAVPRHPVHDMERLAASEMRVNLTQSKRGPGVRELSTRIVVKRNMLLAMLSDTQSNIQGYDALDRWLSAMASKVVTFLLDECVHPSTLRLSLLMLGLCLVQSREFVSRFQSVGGFQGLANILSTFYDEPEVYYLLFKVLFGKSVIPRLAETRLMDFYELLQWDNEEEIHFPELLQSVCFMLKAAFDQLSPRTLSSGVLSMDAPLMSPSSVEEKSLSEEAPPDHHKMENGSPASAYALVAGMVQFMEDLAKKCKGFRTACIGQNLLENFVDLYFSCARSAAAAQLSDDDWATLQECEQLPRGQIKEPDGGPEIIMAAIQYKEEASSQDAMFGLGCSSPLGCTHVSIEPEVSHMVHDDDPRTTSSVTWREVGLTPHLLLSLQDLGLQGGTSAAAAGSVLELIAELLADIVTNTVKGCNMIETVLSIGPHNVAEDSLLVFQGLCLSRLINCIDRKFSKERDGEFGQGLDKSLWGPNMAILSDILVERVYMNAFQETSGALQVLRFHISMLITHGIEAKMGSHENYIETLLKNCNRLVMYFFLPQSIRACGLDSYNLNGSISLLPETDKIAAALAAFLQHSSVYLNAINVDPPAESTSTSHELISCLLHHAPMLESVTRESVRKLALEALNKGSILTHRSSREWEEYVSKVAMSSGRSKMTKLREKHEDEIKRRESTHRDAILNHMHQMLERHSALPALTVALDHNLTVLLQEIFAKELYAARTWIQLGSMLDFIPERRECRHLMPIEGHLRMRKVVSRCDSRSKHCTTVAGYLPGISSALYGGKVYQGIESENQIRRLRGSLAQSSTTMPEASTSLRHGGVIADSNLEKVENLVAGDGIKDKHTTLSKSSGECILRPYLAQHEKVEAMYNCARVIGTAKKDGIFIIGSDCMYVIDDFSLATEGQIRLTDNEELSVLDKELGLVKDPQVLLQSWSKSTMGEDIAEIPNVKPVEASDSLHLLNVWQNEVYGCEQEDDRETHSTGLSQHCRSWKLQELQDIFKRNFLLRPVGIEFMHDNGQNELLLFKASERDQIFESLVSYASCRAEKMAKSIQEQWETGVISNFDYLMHLNALSGRSYHDVSQYPVFPWVLSDYESQELDLSDQDTFRRLDKPMGALSLHRKKQFIGRYKTWSNPIEPPSHYDTHYSSSSIVLSYLVRLLPYKTRLLQCQKVYPFTSIKETWESASMGGMSDVRELTPEFFYLPEFLKGEVSQNKSNEDVDVILPPWCNGSAREFVRKNMEALESQYVSDNLSDWIDLIFGYKQQGQAAIDAVNVFSRLHIPASADSETMASLLGKLHFIGQTPQQLFLNPHPKRRRVLKHLSVHTLFDKSSSFLSQEVRVISSSVNQILMVKGTLMMAGSHRVLRPPVYSEYISWGWPDGSLRCFQSRSNKLIATFEALHDDGPIRCAAVSKDGSMLVTGGEDGVARVWLMQCDSSSGKVQLHHLRALCGHSDTVTSIIICQNYGRIFSGSVDRSVICWDLYTLAFVQQLPPLPAPITAMCQNSKTGDLIVAAGTSLSVWSINGVCLLEQDISTQDVGAQTILTICVPELSDLVVTSTFFTGQENGTIKMWLLFFDKANVQQLRDEGYKLELVKELKWKDAISSLLVTPDVNFIFSGDQSGRICCWSSPEHAHDAMGYKYD